MAEWVEKNWKELTPHEKNEALELTWKRANRMFLGLAGGFIFCVLWIKGNFIGSKNKYSRYLLWTTPMILAYGCGYPFKADYSKLCEAIKEKHEEEIKE